MPSGTWYRPGRSPREVTAESYASTVGWDPVSRMQHVDLATWLPGDILVVADRMTMAHSLELRVPFLDPLVFEAARDLPRREKLHAGTTKYALRQALAGIVPEPVRTRPKLGFPVPLRRWLRVELHDWAREVVRGPGACSITPRSGGCSTSTAPGAPTTAGGSGPRWSS
jgi:asparagine synthase (glutamine-hydrolysing)